MTASRPLEGIRVIELGQLLAGPFAGSLLAYFGAELIKVEPPDGGDAIRGWRVLDDDGTSFWWRSLARNKKCVSIDLKQEQGRALVRQLLDSADVLIENFRPGVMEGWGLGPDDLKASNPGLVYTRISGYGQTGPNASKPGFASVCEGFSGFRYTNGFKDQAPVRPNLSIGDTIAGLHAAFGVTMALLERAKDSNGKGQVIDVALFEAMFNLLEAVIPEYSGAGVIREPSGTTVTGIVPTNTYRSRDGQFIIIGGNGDSIFKRLMIVIGRDDLATDPRLANNSGRVQHEAEIDKVLASWCAGQDAKNILELLAEQRVPAGPIYSVADMFNDPHFQARELFEQVEINGKPLHLPAIMPRLSATPGRTDWPGPELCSHTQEVLEDILGLDADTIAELTASQVI